MPRGRDFHLEPRSGLSIGNIGFLISNAKAQMSNEILMSNVKSYKDCPLSTVKIKDQSRKHKISETRKKELSIISEFKTVKSINALMIFYQHLFNILISCFLSFPFS